MATIKLKGTLDSELIAIGLKEGDVIYADHDTVGKTGAMYFIRHHRGHKYDCVVWPDNYIVMSKCSWCGNEFEGKGFASGRIINKTFCSDSCHKNDYEQHHDNFMSDADPGL